MQQEIVEEAINHFYSETLAARKMRPLDRPKIEVKKYVPNQELEFTAEVEVVPPVKLGNYKSIKVKNEPEVVTDADIDKVIANLRLRAATKTEVERPAKDGDEVWIDFEGKDNQGKAVAGASGKDYPLRLGSKTFIKGFEENLVGVKAGATKEFTTTFPKDYGVKALAGSKVNFSARVKQVKEVKLPEISDDFAKTVGQFAGMLQLRGDIRNELTAQKLREADDKAKDEIIGKLVAKSEVPAPQILIDDQVEHLKSDFSANLAYRGLTLKEYLEREKLTEEQWVKRDVLPQAERRVKTGMVLSAVAEAEGLEVTDSEVDAAVAAHKSQHQDAGPDAEHDKPEFRRDTASRILTNKTLDKLLQLATT
jgi:trigger factor